MKRNIIFLLFTLISLSLAAATDLDAGQKKAVELYRKGEYEQAISIWENLLPKEKESAQIYFNLGNAYYKSGQNASAILNYERALLLEPGFDDAKFNLELAKAHNTTKINEVGEFFIVQWIQSVANWMSSNAWAMFSVMMFVISLLMVLLYIFMHSIYHRKVGFYGALIAFTLCLVSLGFSSMQKSKIQDRDYAIVMAPSVTATSTPDEQGTKLFVLHDGVKVRIKSYLDIWVEIQLTDGNVGWIKAADIEKI
jgi:tetratricopeptide (TPR) repeat protein